MKSRSIVFVVSGTLFLAGVALGDTKDSVIGTYFKVEQAVISGDLNAAKTEALDLAQKAQTANNEAISKDANNLAKAESIDQARQVFKTLSDDTLTLIRSGEGSQDRACSMGCTQCMQRQNTAGRSCMGQMAPGCGMMGQTTGNMCSGMGS